MRDEIPVYSLRKQPRLPYAENRQGGTPKIGTNLYIGKVENGLTIVALNPSPRRSRKKYRARLRIVRAA